MRNKRQRDSAISRAESPERPTSRRRLSDTPPFSSTQSLQERTRSKPDFYQAHVVEDTNSPADEEKDFGDGEEEPPLQ